MTLGTADRQGNLLDDMSAFCDRTLPHDSIYAFMHRERERLFPDSAFADLFSDEGRRSVPPSVVATAMVLQRLEGLSDREAAERFAFDTRWRYAAGVGSYDTGGWTIFSHTVFVDLRERLRGSERPDRVFEIALDAAKAAGLVGKKRVLDSTPLYDAVATMDTITLIRSAIRNLLKVADRTLSAELRAALSSGDEYASAAKPQIDWDDKAAQAELVDSRARDGYAALVLLEGRELDPAVGEAAALLATVLGQDLEAADDGTLQIARRVAPDRVISTVDPETRHGHKTSAHSFDGFKGHAAIDPDSEIITATVVSAGNAGDASVACELIADLLEDDAPAEDGATGVEHGGEPPTSQQERPTLYGDAAYGTGEIQSLLADAGIDSKCKTQPPVGKNGLFAKDRFRVDLETDTVTCPAEITVRIGRLIDKSGVAKFAHHCGTCPLAAQCTTSTLGRKVRVGVHEAALARARAEQTDPKWRADYRATRPKVERKLAHLMRRRHGGRRARVRGKLRVGADFSLLAGAANLARLATLRARSTPGGAWVVAG
ncbi:MAG TPA: IS1182 family transposase [Gaiellaceae bacterium]|nr:IS1182 family transposase [Gaiellaceae bacterium]